jgi:hypothetical protein
MTTPRFCRNYAGKKTKKKKTLLFTLGSPPEKGEKKNRHGQTARRTPEKGEKKKPVTAAGKGREK